MWECIRCYQTIPEKIAEPGIDDLGVYFICPICQRRNPLISLGIQRGFLTLAQYVPRRRVLPGHGPSSHRSKH